MDLNDVPLSCNFDRLDVHQSSLDICEVGLCLRCSIVVQLRDGLLSQLWCIACRLREEEIRQQVYCGLFEENSVLVSRRTCKHYLASCLLRALRTVATRIGIRRSLSKHDVWRVVILSYRNRAPNM